MSSILHITSGDCAGRILAESGVAGEVFVWHDILYDGPRQPGWPGEGTLDARSAFLEETTGGGLSRAFVRRTMDIQYAKLSSAAEYTGILLWFDACLFDQAMLAHILTCLAHQNIRQAELICLADYPGIKPFNGLGQLQPLQMASVYDQRRPVTDAQFAYAAIADRAFALQDFALLSDLSRQDDAPLPWMPAAAARWLLEEPDPVTGLGRLEELALQAVRSGSRKPDEIFAAVAAADTPPQYWGDTTLWASLNALADRRPPLLRIEGPAARLPQWQSHLDLQSFTITAID